VLRLSGADDSGYRDSAPTTPVRSSGSPSTDRSYSRVGERARRREKCQCCCYGELPGVDDSGEDVADDGLVVLARENHLRQQCDSWRRRDGTQGWGGEEA
jgi:hypothetical protein